MTFFSGEGPLDELFSKVFIGGFLFLVKLNEKFQELVDEWIR